MAIKKLQNDFTTPEQSKRLLELGVPADSANLYYRFYTNLYEDTVMWDTPSVIAENQYIEWSHKLTSGDTAYIPCWSVGRLMEIWNICVNLMPGMELEFSPSSNSYIEDLVRDFEFAGEDSLIDFSKLEE